MNPKGRSTGSRMRFVLCEGLQPSAVPQRVSSLHCFVHLRCTTGLAMQLSVSAARAGEGPLLSGSRSIVDKIWLFLNDLMPRLPYDLTMNALRFVSFHIISICSQQGRGIVPKST